MCSYGLIFSLFFVGYPGDEILTDVYKMNEVDDVFYVVEGKVTGVQYVLVLYVCVLLGYPRSIAAYTCM